MKKKFNNIQSNAIDMKYYDKNPFEIENCELIEKLVESSDANAVVLHKNSTSLLRHVFTIDFSRVTK
jgi:hypothetical protein